MAILCHTLTIHGVAQDVARLQYSSVPSQVLCSLNIDFRLLLGVAKDRVPEVVSDEGVSVVVCDFAPLRVPLGWVSEVAGVLDKINVPLVQVRPGGSV